MNSKNIDYRATMQAALEELRQRREEIRALRSERSEPIAIIGMACRFPSAETPQEFWKLLEEGRDAVGEVPRGRWDIGSYYDPDPATPGKMATRSGAFLRDIAGFDPQFFQMSPREAELLDPQQKLLLEVAWEALENANLAAERIRESPVGVYVGITCFDHAICLIRSGQPSGAYLGTGSALNMAAGRLSFVLGLTGPSMAIDTACSSSLVCLHLASESLRVRECRMALVGGVNLMLSPEVMVSFSQARMLSPDGRSKAFDASADGYGRGEGCGVVVLKRLSDAVAEGDRILGVVRGTAVDQGGAAGGLTVPSRASQERVMRRALDQAGINPRDIDYVEAHGTGTSLGDPIEIEALDAVYGEGRTISEPLLIGSVKTNIGHLEPASGIAGLIKILLSFEHERIPAHLHFARPNPHVAWNEVAVRVAAAPAEWPHGRSKRIAGLSAFGFSGTTAHAIVEEPPLVERAAESERPPLLAISAKSEKALNVLGRRYEELFSANPEKEWPAICRAAAVGRSHFAWRMALVLPSGGKFLGRLGPGQAFRAGFVFNGCERWYLRELYETEPRFRESFDRCGSGLLDTRDSPLAIFAADYAWAELWKWWGVKPFAVLGVGIGEYAAACVAGVMSLEDALRVLEVGPSAEALERVRLSEPTIHMISGVTGAEVSKEVTSAAYWKEVLEGPRNCAKARPTLRSLDVDLVPSPRSGTALLRSVAALYVKGASIDWRAFHEGAKSQPPVVLPNYPFERQSSFVGPPAREADEWFYRVAWEKRGREAGAPTADGNGWLIFADQGGLGRRFAAELNRTDCHLVYAGTEYGCWGESQWQIDPERPEDFRRIVGEHCGERRIVFLWGLDAPVITCRALLHLIHALALSGSKAWIVTRDATEVGPSPKVHGLHQSPLWGLAKGAMIEHPERFGSIIDLDPDAPGEETRMLLAEILAGGAEDQVAFRGGSRYVPRLTPGVDGPPAPFPVTSNGAYLITGGFGFLGLKTARWLVDRGARQIALVGRTGVVTEDARQTIEAMRAAGATVRCEKCDLADRAAVERLFAGIGNLRGIVHAAGIAGYRPIAEIDAAELDAVLRPKVDGAWLLHRLSQGFKLDFFVCFSSIASAWGSREQAHYCAANRFLDALAHHRRGLGLPALTLNWGPWAAGGMTTSEAEVLLRRIGVKMLDPEKALRALHSLPEVPQVAIADIDWRLFKGSYEARGKRPFLNRIEVVPTERAPVEKRPVAPADGLPLVERIEREAAAVLGIGSGKLDRDQGFFEMGMDSLLAMELRERLEVALGVALPATLLFDYPNIHALSMHFERELVGGSDRSTQSVGQTPRETVDGPIAVIGMSCRFPGADSPSAYWRLLRDGISAIREVPPERWNIADYYDPNPEAPGKMYSRHGGFLDGIDQFEAAFFRITPREAETMDPQQRLLLEVCHEALEDAHIPVDSLKESQTGVFAGITTNDYAYLQMQNGGAARIDGYFFTGNPLNSAAGRISYVLGLQGPSLAIDTACSSSLVSIHTACQSLRSGECDLALAGGVNLVLSPDNTVAVCRTRALAPDGLCKTFDEAADGFVRSEGCGMLVLKRLSAAIAAGDRVLAVIRGSAVNHDGASSGFTAPNGRAQEAVIRKALGDVAPSAIDYVEAHGTGTRLGDPIEVAALAAAYGEGRTNGNKLRIGSVKTNIGHAEAAAGIASAIKVILALQHEEIPAHLHFRKPSPMIPWEQLPIEVCSTRINWRRQERPRMAGVSAFGASGTNAHIVLEEAPVTKPAVGCAHHRHPLVLSAKTEPALKDLVVRCKRWLEEHAGLNIASVCFALATGRSHYQHRFGVLVESVEDAIAKLGGAEDSEPVLSEEEKPFDELLKSYLRGEAVDWKAMENDIPVCPVSLPTYPFQRARAWFAQAPAPVRAVTPPAMERLGSIVEALRSGIAESVHADVAGIGVDVPFLEMGADSLVLIEAVQWIEKQYGLKLAMHRFFEDLSTIDALAKYIEANLPAEEEAERKVETAQLPAPTPSQLPANPSMLERVLIEQNRTLTQVMAQQMELLRANMGTASAPPAARAPKLPAAAAATAPMLPWGNPVEQRTSGLSPKQREHIEKLIQRYNRRTKKSKESVQNSRGVLADSRASVGFRFSTKELLYPIIGDRAAGSKLWDIDGNEYIDFTMGFGVHLFGHAPDFIRRAIAEEFERGLELGPRSALVGEAAELFCKVTGHERTAFSNTGTEAVMAAMRLARTATGRTKIVIFTHSYHGHADGTLASAGPDGAGVPVAPGVPAESVANVIVLDYGSEAALATIRNCASTLAAVIVEPVQSRNPSLQPIEFLGEIRKITEEAGAALIFDEMITGFRVHPAGAQGLFGITADLATYGKIIGGGLPLGVIAGKKRFMDGIDGGMWNYGDASAPRAERTAFGGTFCQYPLAMAAACAVLRRIEWEGPALQAGLNDRTSRLAAELNAFFEDEEVPIRVTWFGSLFRFEFSTNLDLFFYHLIEKGFFIWEWRTCFLSTAHTEEDLAKFIAAVRETVAELRHDESLPARTRPVTKQELPLSEAQKQLWLLANIDREGSLAYNINTTIELRGKLDVSAMRAALSNLARRHEALRTTVAQEGGSQIVEPFAPKRVPLVEASEAGEWRLAESNQAFDLTEGSLWRAALIRLGQDRHLLSLTAHHIVCDGATFGVLLRDLAAAYNGEVHSVPAMQFREYLACVEKAMLTPEMQADRGYWLKQCGDSLPILNLPLDYRHPAVKTWRGNRISLEISAAEADSIRAAARGSGCTIFMMLLAGFDLLLHRICGQDDIVCGIPVTGRWVPGSENLAGYCTHLLPLRSSLHDHETVSSFLATTRKKLLEALDHQKYPFAELVREMGPNITSAVSAVFNLEPVSALPSFRGLETSLVEPVIQFVAFDLSVNVINTGSQLRIDCDYNTDIFEQATVQRLIGAYQQLLKGMASGPAASAATLPLLSESEREAVLRLSNGPLLPYPNDGLMHRLFEAQAAKTPERPAIVYRGQLIRYDELNLRADRIAGELARLGAGPGNLIGVYAQRDPDMIAALFAVLKVGAAYVPLDPAWPAARLTSILEDAGIQVILTERDVAASLPRCSARLVLLDECANGDCSGFRAPAITPESRAYAIYTSGSTGRPKAVAILHRNAVAFLHWVREAFSDEQLRCTLASTSICFDLSVFEIFGPLSWGASIVLVENALELAASCSVDGVTLVNTVPSAMATLLRSGPLPSTVNTVNLAGEALTRDLVRRIHRQFATVRLYNLYGPSETTTYSTYTLIERGDSENPTVGRPVANTRTYVLDRNLQLLPPGVAGELFIGGAGVAEGYLNRPELTAERFLADPSAPEPDARMYQTGDLARYRPDGNIEFLGRADHQIKLRGFRIELGEVEAVLSSHPWVESAVVAARGSEANRKLVAWLLAKGHSEPIAGPIRDYLRERLPEYMVPAEFVLLKEFPLLPNGKIDRKRLPEPEPAAPAAEPKNEIEDRLLAIWREVLERPHIGLADSFFEIGGNSLSAMQVAARIRRELKAEIEVRAIFAFPTIPALARHIAGVRPLEYAPILTIVGHADYELSPAQRRFWINDRLNAAQASGSLPASFRIDGELDTQAFERAFQALVTRHEILRTCFPTLADEPRQRILSPERSGFAVETIDLAGTSDTQAEIRSLEIRELLAPMDLAAGPLFRVKLVKLSEHQHVCICTMHHIASDGWSAEVLLDDFARLYESFTRSGEPPEPLEFQFKDYAAWLNRLLAEPEGARMKAYWLAKLGGELPALDFPSDLESGDSSIRVWKTWNFQLGSSEAAGLEGLAKRHGATLFMVLLAAIKTLLYRKSGQEDSVVGSPFAGRVLRELEWQVGPYLNVLPLRDTIRGSDHFDALLARVRQTTLDAFANQLYPVDWLLGELGVKRVAGRNPLYDASFTLHNQRRLHAGSLGMIELPSLDLQPINPDALTRFWFIADPRPEGEIAMSIVYDGSRSSETSVRRIAEDLKAIVVQVIADPGVRVHSLQLGGASARPVAAKVAIDLRIH